MNVTKVMPASLSRLFATATTSHKDWFPPGVFEETSKTRDKYWRGKWKTNRKLEFVFYAKGDSKSQIALEISKLSSAADVEKERAAWKKAVAVYSFVTARRSGRTAYQNTAAAIGPPIRMNATSNSAIIILASLCGSVRLIARHNIAARPNPVQRYARKEDLRAQRSPRYAGRPKISVAIGAIRALT